MGAAETVHIERDGGQAGLARRAVRASGNTTDGPQVVVGCAGAPRVSADAIETVRPGAMVSLFGRSAARTTVALDTHRLHYGEVTVEGACDHLRATFARTLSVLPEPSSPAGALLSAQRPIGQLEDALRSMMRKEALKIVIAGT